MTSKKIPWPLWALLFFSIAFHGWIICGTLRPEVFHEEYALTLAWVFLLAGGCVAFPILCITLLFRIIFDGMYREKMKKGPLDDKQLTTWRDLIAKQKTMPKPFRFAVRGLVLAAICCYPMHGWTLVTVLAFIVQGLNFGIGWLNKKGQKQLAADCVKDGIFTWEELGFKVV